MPQQTANRKREAKSGSDLQKVARFVLELLGETLSSKQPHITGVALSIRYGLDTTAKPE
jgi:hypothetical protein